MVGVFETVEQAAAAAKELSSIVRQVAEFWKGLSDEEQEAYFKRITTGQELTPPEMRLREKYGVDWPLAIDWLYGELWHAESAVGYYQNLVFVFSLAESWIGPTPFNELLEIFGGQVFYSMDTGISLEWDVDCDFPDAASLEAGRNLFTAMPGQRDLSAWEVFVEYGTEVKVSGLHLSIKNLGVSNHNALEYLMNLLPSMNASNIRYNLRQEGDELDEIITAPSSEVADYVQQEMEFHQVHRHSELEFEHPIPWITFHARYSHVTNNMSREAFEEAEKTWLQENRAWNEYRKAHQDEPDLSEQRGQFIKQDEKLGRAIKYLRDTARLNIKTPLSRSGNILTLRTSGSGESVYAGSAFGRWLKAQGCDISHSFPALDDAPLSLWQQLKTKGDPSSGESFDGSDSNSTDLR